MLERQDARALFEKLRAGDRYALARAITLVESGSLAHRKTATDILEACLPYSGLASRIGISGAPGVGKSSLIEVLGIELIGEGKRLAVLTIDPSSTISKGSILGDKTRMQVLSLREEAFIRPTAAGDFQGGIASSTREVILLCEAAGYDYIIVETVGVGQSETLVSQIVDCFVLLLLPGAGDDLQGIKRGIVELADILLINKADGENLPQARMSKANYTQALRMLGPRESGWESRALLISAKEKTGFSEFVDAMEAFFSFLRKSSYLHERRALQTLSWFDRSSLHTLKDVLFQHPEIQSCYKELRQSVKLGNISVSKALFEFEQCLKEKI